MKKILFGFALCVGAIIIFTVRALFYMEPSVEKRNRTF